MSVDEIIEINKKINSKRQNSNNMKKIKINVDSKPIRKLSENINKVCFL